MRDSGQRPTNRKKQKSEKRKEMTGSRKKKKNLIKPSLRCSAIRTHAASIKKKKDAKITNQRRESIPN